MDKLQNLIAKLQKTYGPEKSLIDRLKKQYSDSVSSTDITETISREPKDLKNPIDTIKSPLFTDDRNHNHGVLTKISNAFGGMRDELAKIVGNRTNLEKYLRCVDQFEEKLNKLINQEKFFSKGNKLAGEIARILRTTLLKVWEFENFSDAIERFLLYWGVEETIYQEGHYLSDDDLCTLDEATAETCQIKTRDISQNLRVIEMLQPVFGISCLLDDETEYVYIMGKCKYYRYIAE